MEVKEKLWRFFKKEGLLTTVFLVASAIVMAICIVSTALQILDAQNVVKLSPWAWWMIARVFFCICIVQAVLAVLMIFSPLVHLLMGGWTAAVLANRAVWEAIRFILILQIAVLTLFWPGCFRICGSEAEYNAERNAEY